MNPGTESRRACLGDHPAFAQLQKRLVPASTAKVIEELAKRLGAEHGPLEVIPDQPRRPTWYEKAEGIEMDVLPSKVEPVQLPDGSTVDPDGTVF